MSSPTNVSASLAKLAAGEEEEEEDEEEDEDEDEDGALSSQGRDDAACLSLD